MYEKVEQFVSKLKKLTFASTDEKQEESEDIDADYIVDEKAKSATLTARGIAKAEAYFGLENLADLNNSTLSHHINQAIKAHGIMHRDVDYVVKDGEIIIVDEFTGRLMYGRRYSEGLHQAIEAKEGVKVAAESKTLATITFQNYFRMYQKLAGMTGTAMTEAEEFSAIYKLDIVEIPTNRPMIRIDNNDVIYKNENGKYKAIIAQIEECNKKGQPVLVGTISIEKSEVLSALLKKKGIKHNVLNAKHHEKEAEIIAQAGKFGAVTIATNMAGRGTDIKLGGNAEYLARNDLRKAGYPDEIIVEATGYAETDNEEVLAARKMYLEAVEKHEVQIREEAEKVKEAGGLFILGTERHESRRIDNQLRGRSGRQGDPGESRFFISMTDDIMRLFGSERVIGMMEALGVDEDTPIDQKMLSNAIEQAQKKVESRNFQTRKTVLEYDDVMNLQRETIYEQRKKVLNGEDVSNYIKSMISDVIKMSVTESMGEKGYISDLEHLEKVLLPFERMFLKKGEIKPTIEELNTYRTEKLIEILEEKALNFYEAKEKRLGLIEGTQTPLMRELERVILLRVVDEYWMEHIDAMHELRRGIGLRAYGQINPLDEYKREGFDMYETMVNGIKDEVVRRLFIVEVKKEQPIERKRVSKTSVENVGGDGPVKKQPIKAGKKVGRNEPCPCGSGKKYKFCCGRNA
jgi:preprotein translocase subunit SecA